MAKTKNSAEVENGDKSSSSPTESTTVSLSSSAGTPLLPPESDNISTRVGSRTKKAKVVFDPSDNYIPRKRVRKADLPSADSSSKSDTLIPKSPSKSDAPTDGGNNNGTAAKSRFTLSPAATTTASTTKPTSGGLITATSYSRPKVLGSGPSTSLSSSSDGSAGAAGLALVAGTARRHDFIKREPNCDMCHKVEQQRRGFKLIDCSSCAFRAHSKCLRAHPVYQKFPIRLNFRCFQCIECVVCGKSLRGGNLLFCYDCQNAFHANCHGPTNSDSPWVCKRCLGISSPTKQSRSQPVKQPAAVTTDRPESADNADDEAHQEFAGFSDNEIRKDSFSLSDSGPANDSAVQPDDTEDDDEEENDDHQDEDEAEEEEEAEDTVPTDQMDTTEENNDDDNDEEKFDPRLDNFEDIQNWSCEDVYQYFKHYFPDYAHLFKEQEIDGPSLVLMRKSDVLSGFGLKLGPAITLYQRIVMMQNNDRDFRLTWI